MDEDMADLIHVDMRKWPDQPHWHVDAYRLGVDQYGTWIHVPTGRIARRGHEPPAPISMGFVALVPVDSWWVAEFYLHHARHSVYVNICTPPAWGAKTVRFVDLDLDVVRKPDGSVEVLDEDEFAAHRVQLDYPGELVEAAQDAAEVAVASLADHVEPFGRGADPWLRGVSPSSLS
jgi:hypothetical protein